LLIAPSADSMPAAIAVPMLAPTARAVAAADPPILLMIPGIAPMPELTADAERSAMSWAALTTPLFMLLALLTALDCIDSMLAAIPTFMPRTWAELVELMVE